MKTAYELAMERLGGTKSYSREKKQKLSEIDKVYAARKAEIRLRADEDLAKAADDSENQDRIREEAARELARLAEKHEAEKEKVRRARGKG